jgi:hypothetical protein
MKTIKLSILALLFSSLAFAQFETTKDQLPEFDGVKVEMGGDFTLQFQGLTNENKLNNLWDLGKDFNLPTANLDVRAYFAEGVSLRLSNYMSSRHHNEAWVMGGTLQIDNLDFVSPGFLSELMKVAQIRVGYDMPNYGDTHFRRSDNGRVINNEFVGNYIMDSFTTEPYAEIAIMPESGFIGVAGLTNGDLNQNPISEGKDYGATLYGKLGFDKEVSDDLRLRLTGSFASSGSKDNGGYLFSGDRTGARYYYVMVESGFNGRTPNDNFRSGRWVPRFKQHSSMQINPFVKVGDLELYGVYETVKDKSDKAGQYKQVAGDAVYRFGTDKKLYIATRINKVTSNQTSTSDDEVVSRFALSGGWFLTPNILAKLEIVNQSYTGAGFDGGLYEDGKFKGFVFETTISF